RAAVTAKGLSGEPAGRKSAGREVTGEMIRAIATNVETYKDGGSTQGTGWHGWPTEGRNHFEYQERGTRGRGGPTKDESAAAGTLYRKPNRPSRKAAGVRSAGSHPGVPAANSLGTSIVVVREHL